MDHHISQNLRKLRLPGMSQQLELRLRQATEQNLAHLDFLALLVQDELEQRNVNRYTKAIRAARFGVEQTFEGFDFQFNESDVPSTLLRDLATCRFVELKQNVLLAGPPGIGKTHVARALGHEACRRNHSVAFIKAHKLLAEITDDPRGLRSARRWKRYTGADVLIVDDFGLRKLNVQESEQFYELVDTRLAQGVMVVTSNRPPEDWPGIFPDPVMGGAILDRLASGAIQLIVTQARSFRKEGHKPA